MCFSPQRRAIFRHRNCKKWFGADVLCTFWLQNVLLATAACNFSTSELQKVVRSWRVLYILTSKCASRHSGVQFFDIGTAKSGSELTCFVHFDFKMCFSPQRRAIFDFSSGHMTPHPPLFIGKTQRFATSLTFGAGEYSFFWLSRYCIFFLLTLLHLLTLLSRFINVKAFPQSTPKSVCVCVCVCVCGCYSSARVLQCCCITMSRPSPTLISLKVCVCGCYSAALSQWQGLPPPKLKG